jgi:hypothetical protein
VDRGQKAIAAGCQMAELLNEIFKQPATLWRESRDGVAGYVVITLRVMASEKIPHAEREDYFSAAVRLSPAAAFPRA